MCVDIKISVVDDTEETCNSWIINEQTLHRNLKFCQVKIATVLRKSMQELTLYHSAGEGFTVVNFSQLYSEFSDSEKIDHANNHSHKNMNFQL